MVRGWVHQHFWPKRAGAGDYRCCKKCWPEEDRQPSVEHIAQLANNGFVPGLHIDGLCLNQHSPGAMTNHIKDHHEYLLPEGVMATRVAQNGLVQTKVNPDMQREWSVNVVLGALQPVGLVSNKYVRTVLTRRMPGLGAETTLQAEVDQTIRDIQAEVREELSAAKSAGCKFVISADCWKPKMKRRRHYCAVYLNWCSQDFEHKTVCIGAPVLGAPRNGERYRDAMLEALRLGGLTADDVLIGLSDHEGAVRRGMRLLLGATTDLKIGHNLVGCGCHAFQLAPKHGLPPLRPKKKASQSAMAAAEASDEDDDGGSSDGSGSDQSEEEELRGGDADDGAPPARRGRKADPEHSRMQELLREPFAKYRATVKYYIQHEDDYNNMEEDAQTNKPQPLPFCAYATETPCRWSSSLSALVTVIHNNQASGVSRLKRSSGAPTELSRDEVIEAVQFSAVLEVVHKATRLLEGDGAKALGSMYLPVWHQLMEKLGPRAKTLKVPEPLRGKFGTQLRVAELKERPKALMRFLREDLQKIRATHLEGTSGENWLRVAAYLDPRFKKHPFASPAQLAQTRALIAQLALESTDSFAELQKRAEEIAARPDNQPIASLRPRPKPAQKKRKRQARQPVDAATAMLPSHKRVCVARPVLKEQPSDEEFLFGPPPAIDDEEDVAAAVGSLEAEVERQLSLYDEQPQQKCASTSPLDFWKDFAFRAPYVAAVAIYAFSIPGSTAALERLFSGAGRAVTRRRPRLTGTRASSLIFGHANVSMGRTGESIRLKRASKQQTATAA